MRSSAVPLGRLDPNGTSIPSRIVTLLKEKAGHLCEQTFSIHDSVETVSRQGGDNFPGFHFKGSLKNPIIFYSFRSASNSTFVKHSTMLCHGKLLTPFDE